MKKISGKKVAILAFTFLLLSFYANAQYNYGRPSDIEEVEDQMTASEVGFSVVSGGILALLGLLLRQIKQVSGLGQFFIGIGLFMAIGSIVLYLLQAIGMILSVIAGFAIKVGLVIGFIYLIFKQFNKK